MLFKQYRARDCTYFKEIYAYQSSDIVQPGVVVVEVALALVVGLVGEVVQLEEEGKVGQSPQLHLGCFRCVSETEKQSRSYM